MDVEMSGDGGQNDQSPTKSSPGGNPNSAANAAANAAVSFRSDRGEGDERSQTGTSISSATYPQPPTVSHSIEGTPLTLLTEAQSRKEDIDTGTYLNMVMKPKFTRAPITEAGRVAYLGESSNLTLLVHDRQGSADVVHYPLPENVRGSRARLTELDNVEIDILHQRGAFLLPPRSLCDELIDSYFKWVHPIVPVVNRARFMKQYRDPKNPPSLLLLQAVLLAGTRVCSNQQLMDANGSTTPAALTFYKRAKALYDANYEDDRVTIVQSVLLMGWYWEGPEDVTKNVFYWSRVATIVAQGSGMHRSVEQSQLSKSDKRLWKRIWWTLFTRDRSVAVALGRPVGINLDDSDVEMLTEDDFIEDESGNNPEFAPDQIHVQFFLQYVKLCEIMGLVLSQQYSVASKGRQRNAIDLTHSDMALADWLQNCPKIVYWEMPRHHFWSALLHSNYYTTLCLLHRAHMPPNGGLRSLDDSPYPSRNIAFQAAAMITSIVENLAAHDQLRYCPAFIVYSLFSALIMHVYQMRSPVPSIQQVTHDRLRSCMQAMKEVSRVWLVGKMVYTLFESIIGNKVLEERLQKAAGKRHRKMQQSMSQLDQHSKAQQQQQQQQPQPPQQQQDQSKRKFDDMAMDFTANAPTPQESYERSRPQTPSAGKIDGGPTGNQANVSPTQRPANDTFMGGTSSRPQTRPATPFNPSFSVPATPPDLFYPPFTDAQLPAEPRAAAVDTFAVSMTGRPGYAARPSSGLAAGPAAAGDAVRPRNRRLIRLDDDKTTDNDDRARSTNGGGLLSAFEASVAQPPQSQYGRGGSRPTDTAAGGSTANIGQFLGESLTQSWSSVQGFATSILSGPKDRRGVAGPHDSRSPNGRVPAAATQARRRTSSIRGPKSWGPAAAPSLADVAAGSLAERDAALRAAKTASVLESHEGVNGGLDASGRHKRRNSDDVSTTEQPPDDYLVYIHHVLPNDTYAGIILRYQCREDVFRKANGLWSRDSIQTRKWLTLPVDACEIRGCPCDPPAPACAEQTDLLAPSPAPSNNLKPEHDDYFSSLSDIDESDAQQSERDNKPWSHVRWVRIESFQTPVEIGRVSRQSMGYFPPRRKKSILSVLSTPRQSSDFSVGMPGPSENHPTRRQSSLSNQPQSSLTPVSSRSRGGSEAAEHRPAWMRRPGGVGTMGRNVRAPGPDKDSLNAWANKHFPGLNIDQLPSMSVMGSEIAQFGFRGSGNTPIVEGSFKNGGGRGDAAALSGNHGTGLDRAAAAVETWLRGALAKRPMTPLLRPRSKNGVAGVGNPDGGGDLIELTDTGSDDGRLLHHEPLSSLLEPLAISSTSSHSHGTGTATIRSSTGGAGKGKKAE
ncbi:cutinase transcription factor 1 alpha [Cordyceps fumosorosea ARSEF 2679]|uniref:Cutinase transcription factor 1 alpha n=1 Tax=Cordyceps fumosorosea (strain ARSEF 2679) TaxID=1081104 RepID=A0A168AQJ3_CORFA|nr:cutinase transcription factor 1 alpha [Cordyceps fumosorosea ARSEF 2679]OAA69057.1 cutinase transcription factor 1 alpha [Cordyceps fumosorosea ARSEF 2679]